MNGTVAVDSCYINGMVVNSPPLVFTDQQIDAALEKIKKNQSVTYFDDFNVRLALEDHPEIIKDKDVLIPGSESPGFEAYAIYFGASNVTSTDYRPIINQSKRIKTMTVDDFWKAPRQFDLAISYSNFEHDGLGRYGDPLNPNGDFYAMEEMRSVLKSGGYLILGLPFAKDKLVWNAHRVYGKLRLPQLLKNWTVVQSYGVTNQSKHMENFSNHITIILKNEVPINAENEMKKLFLS